MYGEYMYLCEYVKLVSVKGVFLVIVINGMMLDLIGDMLCVVDQIDMGWLYLDGMVLIGVMDGVVCDWICMVLNGYVLVMVIVDEDDCLVFDVWVEFSGLFECGWVGVLLVDNIEGELVEFLDCVDDRMVMNDDWLEEVICKIICQVLMEEIGKKFEVMVIILCFVVE